MKQIKQTFNRTIYFDYLRVFATFAVIILHVSAQNWYSTDVNGYDWQIFNFYDSIVRWGVPVFVMISGSLFLNRDIPFKKIYTKYILRMVIAYIVWSAIYALSTPGNIKIQFLKGHYHMWFIPMIIGLYICIPIIKTIVEDDNITKYFIILAFIFAFAIPEIKTLANDFGNDFIVNHIKIFNTHISNMHMNIVLGFTIYFILGYYINKITLTRKQISIIYILGILGFISTILLDSAVALKTQAACGNYYGNFNVNILFEALFVFTWFKYKEYNNKRINSLIQKLSKYSFGAYLVHALIIEKLKSIAGLTTLSFNSALSVIVISTTVFIISFSISALLNKIPVLNKYIV